MPAFTLGTGYHIKFLSFPWRQNRSVCPLHSATAQVLTAIVTHQIVAVSSNPSPGFPSLIKMPATQQPDCNQAQANPAGNLKNDARFLLHRFEDLANDHEHDERQHHDAAAYLHSIFQTGRNAWHINNRCCHFWISAQRLRFEADSRYRKI